MARNEDADYEIPSQVRYTTEEQIKRLNWYLAAFTIVTISGVAIMWPQCEVDIDTSRAARASELTAITITPRFGTIEGGTMVDIRGTEFTDGVSVNFDNIPAKEVKIVDPTLLRASSPEHEKGLVNVSVIYPDENSRTLVSGFLYVDPKDPLPKPSTNSITPVSGPLKGGQEVTIKGAGFQNVARVSFDDLPGIIKKREDTTLTVITTPHDEGKADVAIEAGASVVLSDNYTYTCWSIKSTPFLIGIITLAGTLGGCLYAIRSSIYHAGLRDLQVSWWPKYYLLPFEGAAMALMFFLAASAGFYTVQGIGDLILIGLAALVGLFSAEAAEKLKKIAEGLLTTAKKISAKAPPQDRVIVTSMEPKSGKTSGGEPVTIIGKGFDNRIIVRFGENDAEIKERTDQESIIAVPPAHAAGKVCVFVIDKKNGHVYTVPYVYEYRDDLAT